MIAVLVAAVLAQSAQNDYFPITPGLIRRYEDTAFPKVVLSTRVDEPVLVGGEMAIPVTTLRDNYPTDRVFYHVTPTEVSIVAYEADKPLPTSRFVFQIGKPVRSKGEIAFMGRPMPLSLEGESHLGGKRQVLGKEVDVLIVTLNATIGKNMEDGFLSRQEMVFAKGIGLVEMKETVNAVGTVQSHTQRLKSFTLAGPGS